MNTIVAIGATHEIEGFALAGVDVAIATTDDELTRAWRELDENVGLVILTSCAADRLEFLLDERPDVLTAVMP